MPEIPELDTFCFKIGTISVDVNIPGHTFIGLSMTDTADIFMIYFTHNVTNKKTIDILIQPPETEDRTNDPAALIRMIIDNNEITSYIAGRNTASGYIDEDEIQNLIFLEPTKLGNIEITDDECGNILRIFNFLSEWIVGMNYTKVANKYVALGFDLYEDER